MDILVDIFNGHFQIAPNDLKDDDDVERALQKKKANAVERALKGWLSGSCPNLSLLCKQRYILHPSSLKLEELKDEIV